LNHELKEEHNNFGIGFADQFFHARLRLI